MLTRRRLTNRVICQWSDLRRLCPHPCINRLHPTTFAVNWDWSILVRSLSTGPVASSDALEFEFVGPDFRRDATDCVAGARLSLTPAHSMLALAVPTTIALFQQQTAIIGSGGAPWGNHGSVYYRAIAVPFANGQGDLAYALCAFSYKMIGAHVDPERATPTYRALRDGSWAPIEPAQAVA